MVLVWIAVLLWWGVLSVRGMIHVPCVRGIILFQRGCVFRLLVVVRIVRMG